MAQLLDCLLGKNHSALLRRAELKTLVDLHANEVCFLLKCDYHTFQFSCLLWQFTKHSIVHPQAGKGGELSHYETTIIGGALDLTQKTAEDAMTPISETFSLDINSKLDM